ncbi:vacuolar endopolyphosphatase [Aspergillus sclerotioniger CBS 115572]|uniref:Endopolyphosphatase n=1 Tax=Aspergillus sclerotioniger CBS 115572 TaxID=1450535 RepID=A0A317VJ63_9EURO|nr:vacuolar endopolyphosphatase [Aspergillus sclerotioniger CBS 115572]PWY73227.1 vacuolar endopolyphosphatase [Aspergillus sclerotioniger CBS 115572]
MVPIRLLSALSLLGTYVSAFPLLEQQPLGDGLQNEDHFPPTAGVESSQGLSGRFLHITDFHPDSYYQPGTSDEKSCHRDDGSAGYFGAEGTECDSPFALINETFRWIETNLKDNIDFVIWTGDSARHDNDEKNPRTAEEIINLNKFMADKFAEVFKGKGATHGLSIPIVPTFGNNDIMPHNIFKNGPNRWTKQYREVWHKFIPEHQRHSFVEGGWFVSEVIPDQLAVISLNTLYFFDSNSAVDGCDAKSEPGYEHMEWLRVQLELLRTRRMKAILIGHVPPARSGTKRSWDESCWQKYTLFVNRFRDVVVGSAYGHMNIDHFMLQDSHKVKIADTSASSALSDLYDESGEISIQSRYDYLFSLRKDWSSLPSPPDGMPKGTFLADEWLEDEVAAGGGKGSKPKKKKRFLKKIGGPWAERYSVSLVSPSVVPNFFPTLRVVEYNITGLEDTTTWANAPVQNGLDTVVSEPVDDALSAGKKKDKSKKKKPQVKVPLPPSSTAPPGPAYSNQALTWLGYTQYYANLTKINSQMAKRQEDLSSSDKGDNAQEMKHSEVFAFEVEYDTRHDKVYKMDDLTVRSFFELATRIAKNRLGKNDLWAQEATADELDMDASEVVGDRGDDLEIDKKKKKKAKKPKNRVWKAFLERAFVGTLDSDELDDIE